MGLHILFRRLSQQQTNQFAENVLEKITLTICDAVRHAELAEFETYSRSDIYLPLTDAQVLTHAAVKGLDVFQNLITVGVAWLYVFTLSLLIGLLMIGLFLFLVLGYELFQKLMELPAHDQNRLESSLFNMFHHILDRFKETKINSLKKKTCLRTI